MKTEKYGKILYGGTLIILSFFFIFYYTETEKIDFHLAISFSSSIVLTIGIYLVKYAKKFPLKSKKEFYFYVFQTIVWLYIVLEISPYGMCRNFLFDTVIGFFIWMSIFGFFFIALLYIHMVETWNELTGENIWERTGLVGFTFSELETKYKLFYIFCIALCLIGLLIVFLKISLFGIILVKISIFALVMSFYFLNKKRSDIYKE